MAVLWLPHRVLDLLHTVADLDGGKAFRFCSLDYGHSYCGGYAAQIVNVRKERRAGLTDSHQAGHGTRGRGEGCCRARLVPTSPPTVRMSMPR